MTIYIVRHGQTNMNGVHALQGRSDSPLNSTGVEQARNVAHALADRGVSFDAVYSSPLQRAVRTAHIIAPEVPIVVDERLIEMDYGPYEGADLRNLSPELATFFSDFVHNPAPAGMEQLSHVVERAGCFIEDLRVLPEAANVLVSTHAIAMKGLLEYLTPDSRGSYWSKYVGNCAVYGVERRGGNFGVPVQII